MRTILAAPILALFSLAACSSGGGIFQPPKSSGIVVVTFVGSSTPLSSSSANPIAITGSFSVALSEANYNASFTVAITSYTAQATQPCYTAAMNAAGTIATFTPRASSPSNAASTINPCAPGTDVEGATFSDQQNHTTQLYFRNQTGSAASGIAVSLLGTNAPLTSSASQPLLVHNAFVLALTEPGYAGPFTAAIGSYTAPTTESCYTVSMDPTGTIATIAPRNAPALAGPSLPTPCAIPGNDVESVIFEDSRGNAAATFFENLGQQANAMIVASLSTTGAVLSTSMDSPVAVNGAFSIFLTEAGYNGPFSAAIVSYTAPTAQPCYTVSMNANQTVATFTPTAPPALNGTTPSPCATSGKDVEGVLFSDQRGNFNEQFFVH